MLRRLLPLLLLAACSTAQAAPREIRPGEDACARCHMTVDDPALAAQWVGQDGDLLPFDEATCLIAWMRAHPEAEGTPYVADRRGGGWIPAAEAYWVRVPRSGRMGSGLEAYREPADAMAREARAAGRYLTWPEVLSEEVADDHAH